MPLGYGSALPSFPEDNGFNIERNTRDPRAFPFFFYFCSFACEYHKKMRCWLCSFIFSLVLFEFKSLAMQRSELPNKHIALNEFRREAVAKKVFDVSSSVGKNSDALSVSRFSNTQPVTSPNTLGKSFVGVRQSTYPMYNDSFYVSNGKDGLPAGLSRHYYAYRGFGWRHPENWKTRTYKCMYSSEGRPCGSRSIGDFWPEGLHCVNPECCSYLHSVDIGMGNVCKADGFLCTSRDDPHSYSKCRCSTVTCKENAECVEEIQYHGGVYCKCKDGYVGNGEDCYEDKCKGNPCAPGKCTQEKGQYTCDCPDYYEQKDGKCVEKNACEYVTDPCGDPAFVTSCIHVGVNEWACACVAGYGMVKTDAGVKCQPVSSQVTCSQNPCGTIGVESCKDTDDGAVCTCKDGYLLERSSGTTKFNCTAINPCANSPCGSSLVAKSCTKSIEGYICECQDNAEVVTEEGKGQVCQAKAAEQDLMNYILFGVGCFALIAFFVASWYFFFRSGDSTNQEFDPTVQPYLTVNTY